MVQNAKWIDDYARQIAGALVAAGDEPPEQFAFGMETREQKGLFRKKHVSVPFKRSEGAAWEVYRVRKMFLMKSVDMRGSPHRQANESIGMMSETYSNVIWLRRDGSLVGLEEKDIERAYVAPTRRDLTYGSSDQDVLRLPDYSTSYREDDSQARRAGYLVWGEERSVGIRFKKPYVGLATALQALAKSRGVDVPLPAPALHD
jgi:hypothetical protein